MIVDTSVVDPQWLRITGLPARFAWAEVTRLPALSPGNPPSAPLLKGQGGRGRGQVPNDGERCLRGVGRTLGSLVRRVVPRSMRQGSP